MLVSRVNTTVLLESNAGIIITFLAITVVNNKEDCYRNERDTSNADPSETFCNLMKKDKKRQHLESNLFFVHICNWGQVTIFAGNFF